MTLERALAGGIAVLGLDVDHAAQRQLLAFAALLAKWNRTYNLTAIREPGRVVTHHLLDALAALPHLPQGRGLRLIDVGSGGGLPGIPLAIARPDWNVILLDSNRKKAAFLRQAAAELGLASVQVAATRVEDYVPKVPFDVAISRAFASLPQFVVAARHLVGADGSLVALKGAHTHEEIASVPPGHHVAAVQALAVPGIDEARHIVIVQADVAAP